MRRTKSATLSALANDDPNAHASTSGKMAKFPLKTHSSIFAQQEKNEPTTGIVGLHGDRGDGCPRISTQSSPHSSKGTHKLERQTSSSDPLQKKKGVVSPKASQTSLSLDPVLRSASPFPRVDSVLRSGSPYPKPEFLLKNATLRSHTTFSRSDSILRCSGPFPLPESSYLRSGNQYPNPERLMKSAGSSTALYTSSDRPVLRSERSNTSLSERAKNEANDKKSDVYDSSASPSRSASFDCVLRHSESREKQVSISRTPSRQVLQNNSSTRLYSTQTKSAAPPILKSASRKDCSQPLLSTSVTTLTKRKTVTYQDPPTDLLGVKKARGKTTTNKLIHTPELVGEAPRALSPTNQFHEEDEDEDEDDDELDDDDEDYMTDDKEEDDDEDEEVSLFIAGRDVTKTMKRKRRKTKSLLELKNGLGWEKSTVLVILVFIAFRLVVEVFFFDGKLASFFSSNDSAASVEVTDL